MDTSTPSSPSWPLSWFELPSFMVAPALRACRLFNTSLDGLFYDVPGLTQALRERDVRILTTRDGDGPLPNGVIDLSAATDPEGALLLIDPSAAPYITAWTNVAAFLESQATAPNPVRVATITGYGVADVMLQGLGGWFGFGLHDRLNIKSEMTKKSDEPRSNSKPSHPDSSMKAVNPAMDSETKPQAEKFKDLARELEAVEDERAFEETLREIAKAPASRPSKPPDPAKSKDSGRVA